MARRHKFPAEEWRKIFAAVAKECSKLHREGKMPFNECMHKYLEEAYKTGAVPVIE